MLGVEDDVREVLVKYRVRLVAGKLHVHSLYRFDGQSFADLASAYTAVWRFKKFSESRFLSLAHSSQALIAGELLGLRSLAARLRADQSCSQYYIKGCDRLGPAARELAAVATLSSASRRISLLLAMDDDRLMRRFDIFKMTIESSLEFVDHISFNVF